MLTIEFISFILP